MNDENIGWNGFGLCWCLSVYAYAFRVEIVCIPHMSVSQRAEMCDNLFRDNGILKTFIIFPDGIQQRAPFWK